MADATFSVGVAERKRLRDMGDSTHAEVVYQGGAAHAAVSFNRPADTTAYAANDVVGAATGSTAALEFTNMGPAGGHILITSVSLRIDIAAIPSGMGAFILHLYDVTPPSALGDNAAHDVPSGDRASYRGSINLGSPVDLGSTLRAEVNAVNKQVVLSGTSLFGYLTTVGGYTPGSASGYRVGIHALGV